MVAIDTPLVGHDSTGPTVREYRPADLGPAVELLDRCGGRRRVRRGSIVDVAALPGLVACSDTGICGLVTFEWRGVEAELVVVASAADDDRTRQALLGAAVTTLGPDCRRLVACTSNADFALQRSLQMNGFRLCAVRAGSVEAARRRSAPGVLPGSLDGIPLRDEVEFELTPR